MFRYRWLSREHKPSTNIQKNVARWKYLRAMRERHQENWTGDRWKLCSTAVTIQQVLARVKVKKRLVWILLRRQRISLR